MSMIINTNHSSPHFNDRHQTVSLIVLHADGDADIASSILWCCEPDANPPVAYHYIIGRTGNIYQLVPSSKRAWHAGISAFNGVDDGERSVNGFSIGVCFGNRQDGKEVFPDVQLEAGYNLLLQLLKQYGKLDIATHTQVALPAGRKSDPEVSGPFPLSDFLKKVEDGYANQTNVS